MCVNSNGYTVLQIRNVQSLKDKHKSLLPHHLQPIRSTSGAQLQLQIAKAFKMANCKQITRKHFS